MDTREIRGRWEGKGGRKEEDGGVERRGKREENGVGMSLACFGFTKELEVGH